MKTFIKTLLVAVIFGLAFFLRSQYYAKVPFPGESMDEYSFSWVGLSLIKLGYPVGISGTGAYTNSDPRYINVDHVFQTTAHGYPQVINYPWFDHPPLLGLITGGFAYLRGAQTFEEASVRLIRQPMLFFGFLSVLLVFLFMLINFRFKAGLVAILILSFSPIVVVGSRMVQAENALIPTALASFIFLSLFLKTNKERYLWLAAILSGVATLFKLSGIFVILTNVIVLLTFFKSSKQKRQDYLVILLVVSLSFLSLFILYGFLYDKEAFIRMFLTNSSRNYGIGTGALQQLLIQTKITNLHYLADSWPLVGWISFFLLLATSVNRKPATSNAGASILAAATLSYLTVYLLFGSEPHGWYQFPLWPFLAMIVGYLVSLAWDKDNQLLNLFSFLFLIPIGTAISKILPDNDFRSLVSLWRLGITAILLLLLYLFMFRESANPFMKKLPKIIFLFLFLTALIATFIYTSKINVDYWYHAT